MQRLSFPYSLVREGPLRRRDRLPVFFPELLQATMVCCLVAIVSPKLTEERNRACLSLLQWRGFAWFCICAVAVHLSEKEIFPFLTWNMYAGQDYGSRALVIRVAVGPPVSGSRDICVADVFRSLSHDRGNMVLARLASTRSADGGRLLRAFLATVATAWREETGLPASRVQLVRREWPRNPLGGPPVVSEVVLVSTGLN